MQTVTLTPPEHFALPTAVEARHLAATFALHRVNSHMPMHRVLPPQHRDYWQEFEKLKTKDNAWQYTPDPFTAQPPTTTAATGRTSNNKLPTKEHQNAAVPMPQQQRAPQMDEKMRKYWESLPAVHMSAENRALVEDVVKKSGIAYAQVCDIWYMSGDRRPYMLFVRLEDLCCLKNVIGYGRAWSIWVSGPRMWRKLWIIAVILQRHSTGSVSRRMSFPLSYFDSCRMQCRSSCAWRRYVSLCRLTLAMCL